MGVSATLASASNDDLLLGGAPSPLSPNPAKVEVKETDLDDKDSSEQGNGAVKANKGMILKKSVEYIRWVSESLRVPLLLCDCRVAYRRIYARVCDAAVVHINEGVSLDAMGCL